MIHNSITKNGKLSYFILNLGVNSQTNLEDTSLGQVKCTWTMRFSFQEPGLDANHIFLGILYLTTTNLETYTLKGWFIISPLWKAVIHKMYASTPERVVTKNLWNQPVSCSLLAEIPHLYLFIQLTGLYVSIFHMYKHYHAKSPTLFSTTSYGTLPGLFLCSHCLIINLHVSSF